MPSSVQTRAPSAYEGVPTTSRGPSPESAGGDEPRRTESPTSPPSDARPAPAHGPLALPALALLAVAAVLMLVLYRPWEAAPFSIVDFSEFLPILKGNATFGDRLRALVSYYASQGRFNPLPYAALAWKWSALGDSPVAWQWLRAGQMFAIFAATVAFLRELRFGWRATACGASLFVTGAAAVSAWTRLTMGEPMALCFALAAAIIALRYQRTERWRSAALAIGVALLAALLTKEMLALFAPILLLVGWLHRGGGEWRSFPERSRRNGALLLSVAAACAIAAVPVVSALRHSRVGSFASNYGTSGVTAGSAMQVAQRFLLPFSGGVGNVFGNLLYAAVVIGGLWVARRRRELRPAAWLAAASLPVAGAVLYVPWPRLEAFYALPALLGSAMLLALAVEALARSGAGARAFATVACAIVVLSSSELAYLRSRTELTQRRVDGEVAHLLGIVPPRYPAMLALRSYEIRRAREQQWFMRGPTLSRYAAAVSGHPVPTLVEMTCAEAARLLPVERPVIVSYGGSCTFNGPPTLSLRSGFDYVAGLHRERVVLGADIVWPLPMPGTAPVAK